jgi:putative tryptophan/tyrosine transport system substrate-binding protein
LNQARTSGVHAAGVLGLLAALAAPPIGESQAPARLPVIGVLTPTATTSPITGPTREALERGLRELGWTIGQTIRLEYRHAEGREERLDELARELVRLPADIIIGRSTSAIRAAKGATMSIPIVMAAAGLDPVELGFVASLAKPGGNVTGLTLLNQDLAVKQLQLLKEVIPRLSHVAVLGSGAVQFTPRGRDALQSAAQTLGVHLHIIDVRAPADLEPAFAEMARIGANGLLVRADPFVLEPNVPRITALAAKHRLPAIYWLHTYPRAAGLMSYGADLFAIQRRAAYFVDRILKGAKPADLPVEEPTEFSLIVNLKTARALGLTIPPSVQARANEVIQ